jgi:tricorn protease
MIAFTGQYDGNTEVFTIPSGGGEPRRVTYTATLGRDDVADRMGPNNIVMTWTPDGKNILYRSRRYSFNAFRGQLFTVPSSGGLSSEIPLTNGGFCSYSPDGKKLAFNRVFREFRTWKYYKGGMADDVWTYDTQSGQVTNITGNGAQDIIPMWHGDEIYFLSDRDRIMNLFAYNTLTKETRKVTNFTDYDIKFPSLGDDAIIFEKGGSLYLYEFGTSTVKNVPVRITNEIPSARNAYVDASRFINTWNISPDGERLVIGARGDIFTIPAKEGITRNLTQSAGVHDRDGVWSPNGKYIAWLSDKTGEFEIYIRQQDGTSEPIQLTKNADTYPYELVWSPDSKKILWGDKKFRLQYVDISTREVTLVEQVEAWEVTEYCWSPDSKWIAYARPEYDNFTKIILYQIATRTKTDITDGWFECSSPVFSNDGNYLLFTSARTFNPIYSDTEWNHAYTNMNKIYLALLSASVKSPFAPKNNEVTTTAEVTQASQKTEKTDAKAEVTALADIKVDLDNIRNRVIEMPVKPSNYNLVACIDSKVYYIERTAEADKSTAKMYDLTKKEEKELGTDLNFKISDNGKKMLVRKGGNFSVVDLPSGPVEMKEMADLSAMQVWVEYDKEWKQIFDESWRQMRDFFYDPGMHGTDWKAIHDKYAALLPFVRHRDDLTYIIGEMIAELSIGHTYVLSGDKPAARRIQTGLLGARLSRDGSGYYRVDEILEGASWSSDLRSPLSEVGVNVMKGEYIIAINGNPTNQMIDIYAALVGMAGKKIELTVNAKPEATGSRKTIVVPIADESALIYYNWVQGNIRKVSEATNGQVGYIHIPDMGSEGLTEFIKHYYPQIMKKGLIIDDRGNGGGNVSPMIIERLNREMILTDIARNQNRGTQDPGGAFVGPKVLLIDNYSASDGDLFAYRFKEMDMGKVIGVRTWGGVVGIRGSLPLIDGGQLNKPEFASYSVDGKSWPIEGYGVDPDIVVDNDPAMEYRGEDAQLNRAIEVILEDMKSFDKYIKPVPAYPDKSK